MFEEWDDHGSPSWPVVVFESLGRAEAVGERLWDATHNEGLQLAIFDYHPGTLTRYPNLATVSKRHFGHAGTSVSCHWEDPACIVPTPPIN